MISKTFFESLIIFPQIKFVNLNFVFHFTSPVTLESGTNGPYCH